MKVFHKIPVFFEGWLPFKDLVNNIHQIWGHSPALKFCLGASADFILSPFARAFFCILFCSSKKFFFALIYSWRSHLALSHFSVLTTAAFFLPASSFSPSLVANLSSSSSAAFFKSTLWAALLFLALEISFSQQPGSFLRDRSRSS